jgi:hypothetical protein
MPLIVLKIRMIVEFFLRNEYHMFFEDEKSRDIALEKINLLISNMLDPSGFYSRFVFFESQIEAIKKKHDVRVLVCRLK